MIPRLFIETACEPGALVTLEGEAANYLARVLRLGVGAPMQLLDGSGAVFEAVLEEVGRERVRARVGSRDEAPPLPVRITLYQGLPKGDKLDWILQKTTELGVSRVVPLSTARSVTRVPGDRAESKRLRWQKIVQEAAEQSERGTLPEVMAPLGVKDVLLGPGVLGLILSERAAGRTLLQALPETAPTEVALFVGPEGGWSPDELGALRAAGAREVTMGPRILRTETAGLAAIAIVMAAYEQR